jgi:hypothetical protein
MVSLGIEETRASSQQRTGLTSSGIVDVSVGSLIEVFYEIVFLNNRREM